MTDETVPEVAAQPASEPEVTATPEPEVKAQEVETPEPPKTFTQEELDAAVGKRLAREAQVGTRADAESPGESRGTCGTARQGSRP